MSVLINNKHLFTCKEEMKKESKNINKCDVSLDCALRLHIKTKTQSTPRPKTQSKQDRIKAKTQSQLDRPVEMHVLGLPIILRPQYQHGYFDKCSYIVYYNMACKVACHCVSYHHRSEALWVALITFFDSKTGG